MRGKRREGHKWPPRRLTEAYIRGLRYEGKTFFVWDTAVRGFMVAVNPRSKSYKVQRDVRLPGKTEPRTVRVTLGRADDLSLDDARTRAMEEIAKLRKGDLPVRLAAPKAAEAWTVADMFEEYFANLRKKDCAPRTIEDARRMLNYYLADWRDIPICQIKRSMAREKHDKITRRNGKVVANQALRVFGTAYNLALRVVDDADALPANPLQAVTFNRVRSDKRALLPDELPGWWEKVRALPNPLRRHMHELGILSGLRPGTLVSIERDWLRLDDRAISIPRRSMKSRRNFDLPLSEHMVEVVRRAIDAGDMLVPGSRWLFPARNPRGEAIATVVWKERTLRAKIDQPEPRYYHLTGHILRHTYRTIAQRVGINQIDARLLLDHRVTGIDGIYIHETALFDRLLAAQERMTAAISAMLIGKD